MTSDLPLTVTGGQPSTQRAARVILVEDDERCRRSIQRDLSRFGYEVHCARNGSNALELHDALGADVLVTDLIMPCMDGLELILTMSRTHPHLPIVAITGGSAADGRLASASERGAVTVLEKPFAISELVSAIDAAVESARPPLPEPAWPPEDGDCPSNLWTDFR